MGGCLGSLRESSTNLKNEEEDNNSENYFEFNIGKDFAHKLYEKFGDPNVSLPSNFEPVIEIPAALGRELYEALVESVCQQQRDYEESTANLIKEDEEFARKLQAEEYSLQGDTVIVLEPQNSVTIDIVDETDANLATFPHPATYYREEAQKYLTKRQQLFSKAKHCLEQNNTKLARRYFGEAQELTKLHKQANQFAAAAFLAENREKNLNRNTIDLHHLYVKEAIQALDDHINDHIRDLQNRNKESKRLNVITGRGKHSRHGIPKIKPAVMTRLAERGLSYTQVNPGSLEVQIFKNSDLSANASGDFRIRY